MLRRQAAPLLFAALTGVVSGVYIFKPMLDGSVAKLPRDASPPGSNKDAETTDKNELSPKQELTSLQGN